MFTPGAARVNLPTDRAGAMCSYSAVQTSATYWHLVHLGSRAAGGAGYVITEHRRALCRGTNNPQENGLWLRRHVDDWRSVDRFSPPPRRGAGLQLAHAG